MADVKQNLLNVQYLYSKLFVVGINRKRFELQSESSRLWAINNSQNTIYAILFTSLGSIFIISGLLQIVIGNGSYDPLFIVIFFIVHPLFGLICLRQLLWLLKGRQELLIENGELRLTKHGTFFTKDKVYQLVNVKNFRPAFLDNKLTLIDRTQQNMMLFRKALLGHIVGQIYFDYKYDKIKVFNNLSDAEKEMLISEINKILEIN